MIWLRSDLVKVSTEYLLTGAFYRPRIFDALRWVRPNARVCGRTALVKSGTSANVRHGIICGIVKLTFDTGENSLGPPVTVCTQRWPSM